MKSLNIRSSQVCAVELIGEGYGTGILASLAYIMNVVTLVEPVRKLLLIFLVAICPAGIVLFLLLTAHGTSSIT